MMQIETLYQELKLKDMTQEEKDLLVKDICARLPYNVKAYVKNWSKLDGKYYEGIYDVKSVFPSLNEVHVQSKSGSSDVLLGYSDYIIKPYLFPMSSMTEEQKTECFKGTSLELSKYDEIYGYSEYTDLECYLKVIDWLNAHHFDFRGLIENELAIDATGLNIY